MRKQHAKVRRLFCVGCFIVMKSIVCIFCCCCRRSRSRSSSPCRPTLPIPPAVLGAISAVGTRLLPRPTPPPHHHHHHHHHRHHRRHATTGSQPPHLRRHRHHPHTKEEAATLLPQQQQQQHVCQSAQGKRRESGVAGTMKAKREKGTGRGKRR